MKGGFNVEVPPLYVACCEYSQDVKMELKHMLPLNGPGSDYWTLRGTLRVVWACASSSSSVKSPKGNQAFLDAINKEVVHCFDLSTTFERHVEWKEETETETEPFCVYLKMSIEFCKKLIK